MNLSRNDSRMLAMTIIYQMDLCKKKKINYTVYVYPLIGLLAVIIINFVVRNLLLVYGGVDYIGECILYWQ